MYTIGKCREILGLARGQGPGVPQKTDEITVNVDLLTSDFRRDSTSMRPAPLPYTLKQRIARTTAHELSHGINVWHHGSEAYLPRILLSTTACHVIVF